MFCIQVKRTKRGKPLTQHSQQPMSSLNDHKQDVGSNTPVHEASSDGTAGNELTESKDPNNVSILLPVYCTVHL